MKTENKEDNSLEEFYTELLDKLIFKLKTKRYKGRGLRSATEKIYEKIRFCRKDLKDDRKKGQIVMAYCVLAVKLVGENGLRCDLPILLHTNKEQLDRYFMLHSTVDFQKDVDYMRYYYENIRTVCKSFEVPIIETD